MCLADSNLLVVHIQTYYTFHYFLCYVCLLCLYMNYQILKVCLFENVIIPHIHADKILLYLQYTITLMNNNTYGYDVQQALLL